ncbi:chaperone protein dnaJ 15 [Panicum miliaceum]|uniref:Chaperone protein dnaJ 15 n=1 Tax=Panicum miliaceum TaxID=4540 RepID=A0A3L6SPP1_PANMI|nr:chaperone protein dnaJ 15 [Panicum miliaceum]
MASSGKMEGPSAPAVRRDPYEVLSVPRDSSDQEIKSAYRKLALKSVPPLVPCSSVSNAEMKIHHSGNNTHVRYHPDKNASNPEASELFKEVAYSYSILSDPEKRRQYDTAGFECKLEAKPSRYRSLVVRSHQGEDKNERKLGYKRAPQVFHYVPFGRRKGDRDKALENEGMDMEIDLSNLGTVNTMFAALFSKLGVPIKTTISPTVLEEAMNGTVTVRPLPVGTSATGKVDKQCAHFFGVTISEEQAHSGIVVRVTSPAQSKFKLLYFEQEVNGGYGLALQEDSQKTGKVTSAGMYFLHFQVYRMDSTVNALAMAKDPEAAFFKRLEGDNFFKPASYMIEAMCAKSYEETTERLKEIESKILAKRNDLRQFETEYRKALARFQEVTNRYTQEREAVDDMLRERDNIHCSFTTERTLVNPVGAGSSSSRYTTEHSIPESPENGSVDGRDKSGKKKWFNLNLNRSDKKA